MESNTPSADVASAGNSPDLFPVTIDKNATSFQAGGHTYYVEQSASLSLIRQQWLEKFGLLAMSGRDAAAFMRESRRVLDALNKNNLVEAILIVDNQIKGLADFQARYSPVLYICSLFINRAGEDRRDYDEELAKQKIEDWMKAGVEADYLFPLALAFLNVSGEGLLELSRLSLASNLPSLDLQKPNLTPPDPFASN